METFADHGINVPNRGGAQRYTKCPKCSDQRKPRNRNIPCLSIHVDRGIWNCHHCDFNGYLKNGNCVPLPVVPPRAINYQKPPTLADSVKSYLYERGITDEVIEQYGIRSSIRKVGQENVGMIHFPYTKDGQVVNVKYRSKDKRFQQEAGAEKIFYGYDDIDQVTIITEGEFDKLALAVAGFDNAISVPDGAPAVGTQNYTSKFDYLANCESKLMAVNEFILALDNDEPGKKLEEELSRRLGRHRCKRVVWPAGCKDANDVLIKHGMDTLVTCIYDAKPFPIEGIIKPSDDDIRQYYRNGMGAGLNPGWKKFGQLYTVKPKQLTVITGAPNSGKSEFLDAMLVNLARDHDWRFMMFSPENAPAQLHCIKFAEKYAKKTAQKDFIGRMTEDEVVENYQWIKDHFEFINPIGDGHSLDFILETAQQLLMTMGINGLVIDPWNTIEHERPSNLSETEYVGKCLGRLTRFAKDNDIHIFVVAHPSKMKKEKNQETGNLEYPPTTLYDIAGSANWFNKADMGLSVYRQEGQPVTVFVQKVRFARSDGKRGAQRFNFDLVSGTYTEVETIGAY